MQDCFITQTVGKLLKKTHICQKTFLEDYLRSPRFTNIARVHLKTPTTTLDGIARADMPSDPTQYLTKVMYSFVQLGFMHKKSRKLFQPNLGPLLNGKTKCNVKLSISQLQMDFHTIDLNDGSWEVTKLL